MFNKLKNLLKLNKWKRILIVTLSFIFISLFAGLSFGLYSNKTTPSAQYQDSIQIRINPTYEDNSPINDKQYRNQIYYNLSTRLNQKYPNNVQISNESDSISIRITGIKNAEEKNNLISNIVDKQNLVITSIDSSGLNDLFFGESNFNSLIYNVENATSDNEYSISFYKNGSEYRSSDVYKKGNEQGVKKVVIWKNFDILNQIIQNDLVGFNEANRNYYKYLFYNGNAPLLSDSASAEGESKKFYFFKDKFELNGKTYHPTDFLVSVNEISEFNNAKSIKIKKSFDVQNWKSSKEFIDNEVSLIKYWTSPYNFNDYYLTSISAENTPYPFFIISIVTFFALVSIFVVINYGYLGIIAILLLSIIVFLSLLMITMLVGDYDSVVIMSIVISTLISFEFIVLFLEKIKKENIKGNSISKSVKTTIKATNKNDYIKAFVLALSMAICYIALSSTYYVFSAIVLVTLIAIPFVMILLMRSMSKILVNIDYFDNSSKTISFINNNSKNVNANISEEKNEFSETNIVDEIKEEEKLNKEINLSRNFKLFSNFNKKGLLISLASLSYLIFGGLIIFLISFFRTGSGLSISQHDKNHIVLSINSNNNQILSQKNKEEIKNELNKLKIDNKNIEFIGDNQINVFFDKDANENEINKISSVLMSKYNVKTITNSISNSRTYHVMKYAMYGILVALIITCLIVLLWLGWTKSLSFFVMSLFYIICSASLLMFGLVSVSLVASIVILASFILFVQQTLSSIIRYSQKLKMKRIEEMDKFTIEKLINYITFKNIRSTLIISFAAIISFAILMIFGTISWQLMLFMILSTIINTIFNILLLPKSLVWLESKRARAKRNKIINQYWETEKIHEQTFSGINNIK